MRHLIVLSLLVGVVVGLGLNPIVPAEVPPPGNISPKLAAHQESIK